MNLKVPLEDVTVPTSVGRSIVIVGLSAPAEAQEGVFQVREASSSSRAVCMFADGNGLNSKFVSCYQFPFLLGGFCCSLPF